MRIAYGDMTLTTDHAASSYGLPVLVIGGQAYGPADEVEPGVEAWEVLARWCEDHEHRAPRLVAAWRWMRTHPAPWMMVSVVPRDWRDDLVELVEAHPGKGSLKLVAQALGMSYHTLRSWWRGAREPSAEARVRLREAAERQKGD